MSTEVKLAANGPILISGEIKLLDEEGNPIDTAGKPTLALCRCGLSSNRPFCDASHKAWTPEG